VSAEIPQLVSPLVVVQIGACTPLGSTAKHSGFLYRVGAVGMRQGALVDRSAEPVALGLVPTLDPYLFGAERLNALVEHALLDFQAQAGSFYEALRLKLVVLLDERFEQKLADGKRSADGAGSEICKQISSSLAVQPTLVTLAGDVTGFGQILPKLAEELEQDLYDAVIVAAQHTDYDPDRIMALDVAGRLFSSEHLDGIVPGEAAVVLTLALPAVARRLRLPIAAQIHSVGAAFEKARPDNDESAFVAAGMTVALHRAYETAPLEGERIGWLMSDISTEVFRNHEFQAVMARTQELFGPPQIYDAPAQRMGYMGAATIPVHLALAACAWQHGYAPCRWLLSMAGSDNGARVALMVSG
jgi:3-oxoacyl-[acyl-carrier-protein] synthase I